ncbi:hypothetical protein KY313_03540, partial [Candidatus Woesearchaeota archaeon]|nr:hypothetical protein [Candidatus Woesearchaeota archaeon]
MPQKGDLDYEEPVSGGLSKDRDAMDDWNKDIAEQVKMMKEKDLDLVSAKGDVEKMSLVKSNFVKFIKENPEGFTISIDGKITPNKGFVVAPIKNTEYRVSADTINMDDIDIFAQNIYALRQATDENINVYGGGWLDAKTNEYVLDAVHIIDNEADALYVAKSGNQDAIFDLGNFNEIRTDIGIKKLKESGAYESNKADEFRANKDKLVEGFEQTGSKSSSITKKDKDIITQEDIDEYGLDQIYLNTKITKSKKISKKLKKDFDEIIAGTKFHQELVVFKPNTPKKIQAEYYKIIDEPDKPQGDLHGEGIEESVIDENIRGSEIYNKYVDINKSEKKLEKFIVYVKENYPEKYFEKIMKRAGIDEDAYVDIGATSDNIITGKNNGKE